LLALIAASSATGAAAAARLRHRDSAAPGHKSCGEDCRKQFHDVLLEFLNAGRVHNSTMSMIVRSNICAPSNIRDRTAWQAMIIH
jgi:hypothetical protein